MSSCLIYTAINAEYCAFSLLHHWTIAECSVINDVNRYGILTSSTYERPYDFFMLLDWVYKNASKVYKIDIVIAEKCPKKNSRSNWSHILCPFTYPLFKFVFNLSLQNPSKDISDPFMPWASALMESCTLVDRKMVHFDCGRPQSVRPTAYGSALSRPISTIQSTPPLLLVKWLPTKLYTCIEHHLENENNKMKINSR